MILLFSNKASFLMYYFVCKQINQFCHVCAITYCQPVCYSLKNTTIPCKEFLQYPENTNYNTNTTGKHRAYIWKQYPCRDRWTSSPETFGIWQVLRSPCNLELTSKLLYLLVKDTELVYSRQAKRRWCDVTFHANGKSRTWVTAGGFPWWGGVFLSPKKRGANKKG